MEFIGVPWFVVVRHLGPPLLLLAVGAVVVLRRRPSRPRLVWAALTVNLMAAALPFAWVLVQALTGHTSETVVGLIMTLLQPAVGIAAWLLLLAALPRRGAPDPVRSARPARVLSGRAEESAAARR